MRKFIDLISEPHTSASQPTKGFNLLRVLEEGTKENLKMLAGLYQIADKYRLSDMRSDIDSVAKTMRDLKRNDRQIWAAKYGRTGIAVAWSGIGYKSLVFNAFSENPDIMKVVNDYQSYQNEELKKQLDGVTDEEKYAEYMDSHQLSVEQANILADEQIAALYENFQNELGRLAEKYKADFRKTFGEDIKAEATSPRGIGYIGYIQNNIINHFLHINYSKIQNYTFGNKPYHQVIDDLRALENEYKEKVSGLLVMYEGDKIIKKMGEYVWVLLDRGYCREEGDAMGHCGNAGAVSGDRILSLRKFEDRVEGEDYYSVYLTFILDRDGKLGEMKGRANEKPAEKYHPYIIELLKMPIVKGIKGGGYLPENNFSLDDLTEEARDALLRERPELGNFKWRLKALGDSEELRKDMIETFKELSSIFRNVRFDDDKLVFMEFKDLADMVDELSKDDFTKKIAGNDYIFDSWDFNADEDQMESLLDDLTVQQQIKLGEHAYNLVKEEEGEDELEYFDMSSMKEVLDKLKEHDDDNYSVIERAVEDGMRFGAEGEAYDALRSAIRDAEQSILHGVLDIPKTENDRYEWDSKIRILFSLEEAAKVLDMIPEIDEYDEATNPADYAYFLWPDDEGNAIKVEEPYYGFSGYDEKAAIEAVLENIDIEGFNELEKAEEPNFMDMSKEDTIAWIKDMYEKIPEGFIRKVNLDTIDEWRIPQVASGLFSSYYGKSKK